MKYFMFALLLFAAACKKENSTPQATPMDTSVPDLGKNYVSLIYNDTFYMCDSAVTFDTALKSLNGFLPKYENPKRVIEFRFTGTTKYPEFNTPCTFDLSSKKTVGGVYLALIGFSHIKGVQSVANSADNTYGSLSLTLTRYESNRISGYFSGNIWEYPNHLPLTNGKFDIKF